MRITTEVRAVGGGYRIERNVSFDGETEGQLAEIYSLLDRQETEQRARIWTKGEHGYFTGSISTGGSGAGAGQKTLDKSAGSGIIESTDGVEELFDRKISKTDISYDLKKVNPNWNTGEPEWQNNCQRCVPAYEMRRRGFEVTAKPRDYSIQNGIKVLKEDPIANDCFSVWERVFVVSFKSKSDIEKCMNEWGDGARAQIRVTFKTGAGHTFVAERIDGMIHFIDPQTGSIDCSGYFDIIMNTRNNRFARIDKAVLKESCVEMCCERERRVK